MQRLTESGVQHLIALQNLMSQFFDGAVSVAIPNCGQAINNFFCWLHFPYYLLLSKEV